MTCGARLGVFGAATVAPPRDEAGAERQFTTSTRTSWQSHEAGQQVEVRYPSGRPQDAQLKSGQHRALQLVGVGLGGTFLVAGLALIATAF